MCFKEQFSQVLFLPLSLASKYRMWRKLRAAKLYRKITRGDHHCQANRLIQWGAGREWVARRRSLEEKTRTEQGGGTTEPD
jgi:hypothetical protein